MVLVDTKYWPKFLEAPKNYDEAVISQHADLEHAMRVLAKKITKYSIQDPRVYGDVLTEMVDDAAKAYANNHPYVTIWDNFDWENNNDAS